MQTVSEVMRVKSQPVVEKHASFRNALLLSVLIAASYGLSLLPYPGYDLSIGLRDGCVLGLGSLLSGWTFQILLDRTPKGGSFYKRILIYEAV